MSKNQFGKKGWTPDRIENVKGKTFVITGTTSGTGYEAAKTLLSKGAKVIMLNRNINKTNDTISNLKASLGNKIDLSSIQMDLADLSSVRKAAEKILESQEKIDALICNAAIAQVPKQIFTVDGFESQLGVNHYGNFLLQGLLYPIIKSSKGRIVVVGSLGYNLGIKIIQFDDMNWDKNYSPNGVYSQSKLAQIMSVYELQKRLKDVNEFDVKVYACHPGASRTSLIKTSGSLMTRFVWQIMKLSPFVQSAERGAYPQLMCATEDNLDQTKFYGPTKRMNTVGPVGAHHLEPHAKDKTVSKRLWELSEKETDIKWKF